MKKFILQLNIKYWIYQYLVYIKFVLTNNNKMDIVCNYVNSTHIWLN